MAGKIVYIVEDDDTLRAVLADKLRTSGYQVLEATNGEEALAGMSKTRPDIVLLDMMMPIMGGMQTLEHMQKDEALKTVPVVVISNSGQPVEVDEARRLGAKDFLIKAAFDPEEVLEKVRAQLGEE